MNEEGNKLLVSLIAELIHKNAAVLEIGCGTGELLHEICEKYDCNGIGIDPFTRAQKNQNPKILSMRAEEINKLNETFDLIYSIRSFHHIGKPELFAAALSSILKPEGYFILVDWKQGFNTGIPERYYSLPEVKNIFSKTLEIVESKEMKSVFYIILKNRQGV